MKLYPVNLDIRDRPCLIIGGGRVAARKIGSLHCCGARITVISPEVHPAIHGMAREGKVDWRRRAYRSGDMDGAFLVFAATDNRQVQRAVVQEAQQKGILVNSADDPDGCSFQVPARVRRGKFLLTVSTGGASPALAARLRKTLEEEYGREYQQIVELLSAIRERIVSDGDSQKTHKELFERLLELDILARIRRQDWTALQAALEAMLPQDVDVLELIASIRDLPAAEPSAPLGERPALNTSKHSEQ